MTKPEKKADESAIRTEDFKDRVRFPTTMHVDEIEFQPSTPLQVITRTAYDLMLGENDCLKLHAWLSDRIERKHYIDARIRFTGREEGDA